MAVSVKMSSKNQIVVPKEAREALDLQPGDRLVVSVREDGVLQMERQPRDLGRELEATLSELATAGRGDGGLWEELDHE